VNRYWKLIFTLVLIGLGVQSVGLRAQPTEQPVIQKSIESFEQKVEALLTAWNTARNTGDVQALADLHRPEDREAVLNAPARGRANATITIRSVQRTSDDTVRVRFTRSWPGANAGRVNGVVDLVLIEGEWFIAMNPEQRRSAQAQPDSGSQNVVERAKARTLPAGKPQPQPAPQALLEKDISVGVGRVRLVQLPFPAMRVAIGDPSVADFTMVSPTELYVLGRSVGITNMILWDKSNKTHMIDATVTIDLKPLKESIAASVPKEKEIRVSSASGSVVLSGSVADTLSADAVVNLAEAYVSNLNRYLKTAAAETEAGKQGAANLRVINLMKIRDPQQVMLEVRIAEVSKDLMEKLGFKFSSISQVQNTRSFAETPGATTTIEQFTGVPVTDGLNNPIVGPEGQVTFGEFTNTLTRTVEPSTFQELPGGVTFSFPNKVLSADPALGALSYLLSGRKGRVLDIEAQKRDDLVKILAEPTIVALSGKEGSFTAGGRTYIPVPVVSGGSPTLQEVEYGVILKFVPTVLDGGRISLKVAPEVSEPITVDLRNFAVRKVSSTVELKDGETLVIGGLLKNNVKEVIKAFPILGEIPILGVLFRSSEFQNNRTELVVVVSPSLVRGSLEAPTLPTDNFIPPTRSEFFFGGKMEGSPTNGGSDATR
jgi:pilus assembly protein CpaC